MSTKAKLEKFQFSPRQLDVARYASVGMYVKSIADRLGISARTVEGHLTAIRRMTGTVTTAAAGCKLAKLLAR